LVDRTKSERNDSLKDIYAFTEEGHYVAWLIEAKYQQNQEEKIAAYKKIIEILEAYFGRDDSALSIVFTRFLTKYRNNLERDNSLIRSIGFVQNIFPSSVRKLTNKNNMLMAVSMDRNIAKIFLDAVKELDKETLRLVFFQLKLDVESCISTNLQNMNREWENTRYNNISDYNKLTTLQYCEGCKNAIPYKVDVIDFLESSIDLSVKREDAISKNKFYCDKCGRENAAKHFVQYYESWILGSDYDIKKIGNRKEWR
jgi:hypothetical protein